MAGRCTVEVLRSIRARGLCCVRAGRSQHALKTQDSLSESCSRTYSSAALQVQFEANSGSPLFYFLEVRILLKREVGRHGNGSQD
jgi:hypothetical protein